MLRIINSLQWFFEDNYRRINVREYARLKKISAPTASKQLSEVEKEGLLKKEEENRYFYYSANKGNKVFIELSRIYWYEKLINSGLINQLNQELVNPLIILFGSLSKAEVRRESDIDLAVFSPSNKKLRFDSFEKKLGRNIQLFLFNKKKDVKSNELFNSILNGFIIKGEWT